MNEESRLSLVFGEVLTSGAGEIVGHVSANSGMASAMWPNVRRCRHTLETDSEFLKSRETQYRGYHRGIEVSSECIVYTSGKAVFCDQETRSQFNSVVGKGAILYASMVKVVI